MSNNKLNQFFDKTKTIGLTVNNGDRFLIAEVRSQKLYVYRLFNNNIDIDVIFNISTGKNQISCIENSLGTPIGMHKICEKIGDNTPIGTVFVGRKNIGMLAHEYDPKQEKSFVTTRILRLIGLESGINSGIDAKTGLSCDTYQRYVYIHGLSFDQYIKSPSTQGCIALKNVDMLNLFNLININTLLLITP